MSAPLPEVSLKKLLSNFVTVTDKQYHSLLDDITFGNALQNVRRCM